MGWWELDLGGENPGGGTYGDWDRCDGGSGWCGWNRGVGPARAERGGGGRAGCDEVERPAAVYLGVYVFFISIKTCNLALSHGQRPVHVIPTPGAAWPQAWLFLVAKFSLALALNLVPCNQMPPPPPPCVGAITRHRLVASLLRMRPWYSRPEKGIL